MKARTRLDTQACVSPRPEVRPEETARDGVRMRTEGSAVYGVRRVDRVMGLCR